MCCVTLDDFHWLPLSVVVPDLDKPTTFVLSGGGTDVAEGKVPNGKILGRFVTSEFANHLSFCFLLKQFHMVWYTILHTI